MRGRSEVIHATPATPARVIELPSPKRFARKRRLRRIIAAVLFVLLAGLLLPLVKLGRYHRTIADSLSRSLGHTVTIGSANLSVFPLPSLVIHDLTVEEDPAFGAEPLLRSPEVTVYLRVSSLWRQRLEISRIDLDNASVNLVRDPSARWNFSSLLLQASHTPTAPTAQRRRGLAPRFPYIEFTGARINFKEGAEKKAFSFLNADASVWLAEPNRWEIRFRAQPARTDLELELEDMGTVRLEGSLTRAASLDLLPLDLHAEWAGAQLGQVSRLIFGSDSGWRGDLRVETDITGDVSNLALNSRLRVINAHRQEFTPINQLDIDTRCQATYRRPQQSLDNLTCLMPTGDGHLLLTGAVPDLIHPAPRLNLEINHTPVAFAFSVLGLLRSNLSSTLSASGLINGNFALGPSTAAQSRYATAAAQRNVLTGHAVAENVSLDVAGIDRPFTFAALTFATPDFAANSDAAQPSARRAGHHQRQSSRPKRMTSSEAPLSGQSVLILEPASLFAGTLTPMEVSGQFTRSGFTLHFTGEAALARLQPITRDLSQLRPFAALAPKGTATSDLTFSGPWVPFISAETGNPVPTQIEGWTRLEHAEISPAWLPEPVEIASATAQLENNSVAWTNAAISLHGISAKGSATYPANCTDPAGCPPQFTLDFAALDAAALQSALGGGHHGEFVQAILSTVETPTPWPALTGNIHAATLTIGTLKLSNVRAAVAVHSDRSVKIASLDAATLGGSAHAAGSIEPASDGPKYALDIALSHVKLPNAAALFHEQWGSGSLDGQLKLTLNGYSGLASTAAGEFHWTIKGDWAGTPSAPQPESPTAPATPSVVDTSQELPPNLPPALTKSAHPESWSAAGTISNRTLVLTKGPAVGTITFDRKLDLDWTSAARERANPDRSPDTAPAANPDQPIHVTGTLAQPITSALTQPAVSKPSSAPN